jgi:uncharacterized protein (TIGR00299 family) protein
MAYEYEGKIYCREEEVERDYQKISVMIIAYFDLFSGVSGDMFLSAFVDAGLPQNLLKENLQYILSANEYKIDFKTIQSHGISGKQVDISENPLTSRSYSKIINSIQNSKLDKHIKEISKKFLKTLALAEAKIHSLPLEKVHFHEIGAVDTIIDIVGIATAIEYFKIDKVFISDIPVGSGEINCLHGTFPNPAPATSEMLKGFNVRKLDINAELTTPTGVAVLKGVNAVQSELPVFKLENIGYGFGKQKITDRPNFLRILIGKAETDKTFCNSNIYEIEFNVDDMTGEQIGYFLTEIFKFNIVDVQCISTITKKNRPGYILKIYSDNLEENLLKFIFEYSTTSGIRYSKKNRIILDRYFENSEIRGNLVRKKIFKSSLLGIEKAKLEFDEVSKSMK